MNVTCRRIGRCCFLLILLLVVLVQAKAHSAGTGYQELSVVFLVDQSGSMGGPDYGSPTTNANDPLGLRFEAVQYALRSLGQYKQAMLDDITFKMAVVYFGDDASSVLNWITVDSLNSDWEQTEKGFLTTLSSDYFGKHNLGNTNFKAAFRTASDLFEMLPDDSTQRLKVIVVLTDGAPCAPNEPDWVDANCMRPQDQVDHMTALIDFAHSTFPSPDFRIYVIAIDAQNGYWPRFSPQWDSIVAGGGWAKKVETSTDVGQSFLEILIDLVQKLRETNAVTDAAETPDQLGVSVPLDGTNTAEIDVSPFYQTLRITVFKATPQAGIVITDPNGMTVTPAMPQVSVTGTENAIEVWTVRFPEPGTWRIVTTLDTNLLDVYLDLLKVDWELTTPSESNFTPYLPFDLTLKLFDSTGQPLPDYGDAQYALKFSSTLHLPGGQQQDVFWTPAGTGIYTTQITPTLPGDYQLDLTAGSQQLDGSSFTVLQKNWSFSTTATELEVTGFPTQDILVSEKVSLAAQVVNDTDDILFPSGLAITAHVLDQTGNIWAEVPLLAQDDGRFAETIEMRDQGQYRIVVQAVYTYPDGSHTQVGEQSSNLFNVDPADFLLLDIASPKNKASDYSSKGFFSFGKTGVEVLVQVIREDDGSGADLADYTDDPQPLLLLVTDAHQKDVTNGAILKPTEKPGQYRAVIKALGNGQFTITVSAKPELELSKSTLFASRANTATITIERRRNILPYIAYGLLGLVILGIIIGCVIYVIEQNKLKKHPATGSLSIIADRFDADRFPVALLSLPRKNHIVLNKSSLRRIPAELGIRKIIVDCPSQRMYETGRVNITVVKRKKQQIKAVLGRGVSKSLGETPDGTVYYIFKDYDDLSFVDYD